MTQTHTSGPWSFTNDMYGIDNMRVFGVNDSSGQGVANCGHDYGRGHCEANARLIAAAPDMFAALELALERLQINDCEGEERESIAVIERAIAKAKGQG